jgi:hypothetical protein
MGESSTARARLSTVITERPFQKNQFGTIVRALWKDKPALNLAQRIHCSERAAQFYIDGERKPSALCIAVIVAEMLT